MSDFPQTENTPKLETSRLILRRFAPGDEDALFALMSDREVNTFLPWFPLVEREEAERLLGAYLEFYQKPWGYRYAVCPKGQKQPIGYVHLGEGEPYDLGYAIAREHWGNGMITEACQAVVGHLRQRGLVPYLTATHDRENPASGRVMQKLGMAYCYSYQEQWQPKGFPVVFRLYQLNLDGRGDWVYRGYWERHPMHFKEEL